MISWCSWNVRGLNDPMKCRAVHEFLQFSFVEVCYLVETRVQQENFDSVVARFGMKWGSVCRYSVAGVRRNWVLWNASLYDFRPGVVEDHVRPEILT